ncbi:MAG: FAD-dependent oxidoreductase, partial [Anaerovoracaceae bacterium]
MKYDVIIIGFGKGGKTLAATLAKKGEKVALIEASEKMYGGTCINVGCIPSKYLVDNAEEIDGHMSFERKAEKYGRVVKEKKALTAMLRKKNYDKLDGLSNVDIIVGTASFIGERTVKVQGKEEMQLSGEKIIINTGSLPVIPNIPGIEANPNVYTSESLMEEEDLPRKLTIIGGGYIGLEFASMYAGFGSDVTMLIHGSDFIPREDEDIASEIKKSLEDKGVKILMSSDTKKVDGSTVVYDRDGEEFSIEETKVLIATGRRANTKALDLENAGVQMTDRGLIKVDEHLKTTAPGIWAMGDVCEPLQFTYISLDDYRIVSADILRSGEYTTKERKNVPYSVFLSPTFSRVGINEKEAKKQGRQVKVVTMPAAAIPKAQVLKKPQGILKGIIDKETGKILGVMLFCQDSHEMINIIKLA